MSDQGPRHEPTPATNQLSRSWWYRFYFSPPTLSAGSRGVKGT